MTSAYIISEYHHAGRKQIVLERLQGTESSYRVIVSKRFNTLEDAKKAYLEEIPKGRMDYYSKTIEDYALQNGIKPTQAKPRGKPPKWTPVNAKGWEIDQSKFTGA